ncbi:hypothetical protein GLOTRDRAFT_74871 [Gloeophyllum trabeum ATCC 11539]|uniref:BTB domain-containing protein n=1 Tax=Gloeophyllum trabeum (strain ATCC 11539 / FP-39264 / Madison 617) TaxID=670483 RepID=S7RP14_GLOTA|nr:uncharacterized protein GLOTRDRAFT_74871 [Gloeophyllum trabeum ATCC 11539]EPQ56280.1 hypothetical protein GLOTRDRAFT_74871 [Gloeophyllum trabeum ATCC 11539]
MAEAQAAIKTASPPFDRPDADLVLRSCDGIDFRVYKSVLSLVSPVFETMFTLPQPGPKVGASEPPVVQMTEDERTLYLVLQFCYPGRRLELKDLTDMVALLEFAEKHDFEEWLVSCISLASPKHLEASPLRVYTLACLYHLPEEARSAARATLQLQRRKLWHPDSPSALEGIPATTYIRLLQYHENCGDSAASLADTHIFLELPSGALRPNFLTCQGHCESQRRVRSCKSRVVRVCQWWVESIKALKERLREHPCSQSAVDFCHDRSLQESAVSCGVFESGSARDLHLLSLQLSQKIDDAVSQVSIPFGSLASRDR